VPLPEGLEFLYVDNPNSSLLALQAFKTELEKTPGFEHLGLTETGLEDIRQQARESLRRVVTSAGGSQCILSAEAISTFSEDELQEMHDFFAPDFDEIQVFIYVRPIKERIESGFQEVLKTRFRSVNHRIRMNYMVIAERFDTVFGPKNVHFFRYSRDAFPDGSIIADFLQQFGAAPLALDTAISNTRLSREAVKLLYTYRRNYPSQQSGDGVLIRKLESLMKYDSTPFRFHSSLYNRVLLSDESTARRFSERSGFSVNENISAHDSVGVRDEEDLLAISREAVEWLNDNLPPEAKGALQKPYCPVKIAEALDSMRLALSGD